MARQELQDLNVWIVTWNVAESNPPTNVTELLGNELNENRPDAPDIIVFGLQEMKLTSMLSVKNEKKWSRPLKEYLYSKRYVKLFSKRQFAMLLLIFVKPNHIEHIRHLKFNIIRTGLLGVLGNKGAIICSFRLYGAAVCFTTSHLPAHEGQQHKRMEDYKIIKNAYLGMPGPVTIFGHNFVFWFGDLNFRILAGTDREQVTRAIKVNDFHRLTQMDEYMVEQSERKQDPDIKILSEAPIRFPPTFKLHKGGNEYDDKRCPAWTDRILFWSGNDPSKNKIFKIENREYRSLVNFVGSDHKPVRGKFIITVYKDYIEENRVEFGKIEGWHCDPYRRSLIRFSVPPSTNPLKNDRIVLVHSNLKSFKSKKMPECRVHPYDFERRITKKGTGFRTFFRMFTKQIEPGTYRLVYLRDYRDCLGVSDEFTVTPRDPSEVISGTKRPYEISESSSWPDDDENDDFKSIIL